MHTTNSVETPRQPQPSGARPSPRRRRAYFAVAAAATWLCCELGGVLAWRFATGSWFTWRGAAAVREAIVRSAPVPVASDGGATTPRPASEPLALHPYLGYVYDPTNPGAAGISPFGFVDREPPIRPADDRYVVAITGGSVALFFADQARERLASALQGSPGVGTRKVDVVCLALGGYKQPQQLLALALVLALGARIDCVLNIDGFNEVALVEENLPHGVPPWYPRSWARLLDTAPSTAQLLRLGRVAVLREQRAHSAASWGWLQWSPLAQFLWLVGDRADAARIASALAEAERAAAAPSYALTGPGTDGLDPQQARARMVELWARSSREMDALCRHHGITYRHFLQPNQYVAGSKPIGPEEAARALRPDSTFARIVAEWYPRLQAEGAALRQAGVPFTDLTGVFRDHPEPLYVDTCCHLSQAGNHVLAEYVAVAVRADATSAGAFERLRVDPERVLCRTPLPADLLRVLGVDGGGVEHALRGEAQGVRFGCTPEGFLRTTADGRLWATRRGAGVLHVSVGALQADVPVEAAWPDRWSGADGHGAAVGGAPLLELQSVENGVLRLAASRMQGGAFRVLAWSEEPLPTTPAGVDARNIGTQFVDGTATETVLTVAHPLAPERPLFVRLFVLAHNATEVLAASNTVVVTVGR